MENDSNPNSVDPDDALARIQQEMSEQAAIEAKVQANIAKIHEKAEKDGLSEDIAQDFVEKYLQSLGR
jgi:urocanate hydratase